MVGAGNHHTTINLADFPDFNEQELFKRISQNKPLFDAELFKWTHHNLIKAFRSGWAGKSVSLAELGFDYGFTSEVAQTMMETNLFHFSAAKTAAEVQELNRLFRAAPSFSKFAEEAQKLTKVFNIQWMQTEYDTAFLTAESSATYYRLLDQTNIFPYWEYKTAGDGHVRHEHVLLDGLILPANDPRWNKIMPPNGWNCRCYIVPRTRAEVEGVDFKEQRSKADNYMNGTEFKKAMAQGWGVNRAELKQVFDSNQMYLRKFPGRASKKLEKLTYKNYGLKSISSSLKQAFNPVAKFTGTADAWKNGADKITGDIILKDYNQRNLVLTQNNYKIHTTGKRADRVEYLNAMKETLLQPDEIWLNGSALNEFRMVKFYKDDALVVIAKVEGGKVNTVQTWFPMAKKSAVIDKFRSGLLIKKPSQ